MLFQDQVNCLTELYKWFYGTAPRKMPPHDFHFCKYFDCQAHNFEAVVELILLSDPLSSVHIDIV